ncbi:hypothetical protein MA16_Dca016204 [Dendrobium catenatum]|uniref:Uncharacterized protein n=1 Tax=Dendrobium catenatum TaxID=906689 RepID=A0A2I0WBV5_9ASPA|nr:hypothetical protein MA16_Dca016204 [Dendrobium catenatum]
MVPDCGLNEEVDEVNELNHCLANLVASPVIYPTSNVDVSDNEPTLFDDDDSPAGGEINAGTPIETHAESGEVALITTARLSPLLPEGVDPVAQNVNVPLLDVHITVILSEALLAQLDCKSRDKEVLNSDWIRLDDGISSIGEWEMNEKDLELRDNFDLSILQIVDVGFFKKSGKHKTWKLKKK